ncbi:hypothetical protein [Andreprevotia chitinilytica]|uniref:hypothetical protein n=1 Tax=Andreprevotia chitinilytica TaxID=396808 RepID=UPI0012EC25BA|nr:hypothetical protein [Andreprevotia chitinilytica]
MTTLKLSADLKARITQLAQAAGQTPQAWMVDALEAQVQRAEQSASVIRMH